MPIVISHNERTIQLRRMEQFLGNLRAKSSALQALDVSLQNQQQPASTINTLLAPYLTALGTDIDTLRAMLDALSVQHQYVISPLQPVLYAAASIDAIDPGNKLSSEGVGRGTIKIPLARRALVSPFVGLLAGDSVSLSKCADADNNGTYELRYTPQPLGSDVIATPDFSGNWTTSDWDVSTPGFALHNTGNTTPLSQAYGDMNGVTNDTPYLLSFAVVDMLAGTVTASFDGAESELIVSADGNYEAIVFSDSGGSLTFTPSSSFDGKITGVSMLPFTGLAFTRALGADNAEDTTIVISLEER